MPFLIQLKTDLTSLKYGSDRPGGGWSGQPYMQFPIQDDTTPPTIVDLYNRNRNSLDFPARGGGIAYQIGTQTYTLASQIDKSRIKKFFEDKPRGSAFIQKQIDLQFSNPKMETGNTLTGMGQGLPISGLLENTRVYNSNNTLTQVGVQGTGVHTTRHGNMPFNLFEKNYAAIVGSQNVNNDSSQNRLLILQRLKMSSNTSPFSTASPLDINTVNNLGISLNRGLLFQYLGGPGSSYGVGSTTIKRADDTTSVVAFRHTMVYDQLMNQKNKTSIAPSPIQDFRAQLKQPYLNPWNYQSSSLESRLNIGNPGTLNKPVDYTVTINKGVDKLNALPAFLFEDSQDPWSAQGKDSNDLIKFGFEAISNDNFGLSNAIIFRAFLGSIADNNSAELTGFKYMGRGETFRTYQGFDRSISFSFKIAPQSRSELLPLYTKLNHLISQVYPDYAPSTNFMRAPVIRLTIGDYIYRMPGFLENVNVTIDGNTSWEIMLDPKETGVAQLPHSVDVSVSFKPIFDILPQRTTENSTTALITKSDGNALGNISLDVFQKQFSTRTQNDIRNQLKNIIQDIPVEEVPPPPIQ